jgi:hypothetical protein
LGYGGPKNNQTRILTVYITQGECKEYAGQHNQNDPGRFLKLRTRAQATRGPILISVISLNSQWSVFKNGHKIGHHFWGQCHGTFYFPNCPCRHAQRAVCRDFVQQGPGPTAGNLFAGTVILRHATSLPKAVRGLYGDWLLDCRACKKMRI